MVAIQGMFDGQSILPLEALPTGKKYRLIITFVEEIGEEEAVRAFAAQSGVLGFLESEAEEPAQSTPVETAPVGKPKKDFSKYWGSAKTGMTIEEIDEKLNHPRLDQVAEDDVMQYFGILQSGLTSDELDQKLTQMRQEWDRNF